VVAARAVPVPALAVVVTPVAVLPGIASAHVAGVSVLLLGLVVGSWGRELWVAVAAAAPLHPAVESETLGRSVLSPSAGPGSPAVAAGVENIHPDAAVIEVRALSIPIGTADVLGGAAAVPVRVAPIGPGAADVGLGARDKGVGARDEHPESPSLYL
jgi:hypothetical protein